MSVACVGKEFSRRDSLVTHMSRHTPEEAISE